MTPGSPLVTQIAGLQGAQAPAKATTADKAQHQGREFESVFLSQVLAQMFATLEEGSGPLGAQGAGGDIWRSFLTDEYAKEIVNTGGIGIADQVMRELISLQEQK